MGVYYYLNHPTKKESFELNKGCWEELGKSSSWIDCESLLTAVLISHSRGMREPVSVPYVLWLRDQLWGWCYGSGVPSLVNDAGDSEYHMITGTRFQTDRMYGPDDRAATAAFVKHIREHYFADYKFE